MSVYVRSISMSGRWQALRSIMLLIASMSAASPPDAVVKEPVLDSYCNLTLGGPHTPVPRLVDCSCCATHFVGDYAAQVELLFGGRPERAPANAYDGQPGGEVQLWSLGDYVPEVSCVDGQAMCNCADKDGTWVQYEPTCRIGPLCRSKHPAVEWPSVCQEGKSCSARDRALGREGGGSAAVEDSSGLECEAAIPANSSDKLLNLSKRISLGSARCEDMEPEQCDLFYAKGTDGTWRHCEVTSTTVRQCPASTVTEEDKSKEAGLMEAWVVKNAYLPRAWPVEIKDDSTMKAVTQPDIQAFMNQIENLPGRRSKTNKL